MGDKKKRGLGDPTLPKSTPLVLVSGIVEIPHHLSVPKTGTLVTISLFQEQAEGNRGGSHRSDREVVYFNP